MEYTDSEIREELARLGYTSVSEDQLGVFKLNLMKLIRSEQSKRSSMESRSTNQEASGNISNHGNQWLENTTNHNTDWLYNETDTSYGHPGKDVSAGSSLGHTYGTHYSQPDVTSDIRGSHFSSDLHRTYLRNASSEPNVRPKSVKWNLSSEELSSFGGDRLESRDSVKVIPAGEARHERAGLRGKTHEEDGGKRSVQDYRYEIERPASADIEINGKSYEGYRGYIKKMPGIITRKEHPHTRNLVRTKPFQRHQMYMQVWKARPPVCEASRSSVCREVHRKLLKKEEIVKVPSKTLTPNSYIVPTDKPRYELRWAVRQCNENYEMPPCGFFQES